MFNKIRKFFKKAAKAAARHLAAILAIVSMIQTVGLRRTVRLAAATDGEAYVDTGVKILIAVVVGALLLAGLYALFGDTIMPTVTEKVEELFNYAG